MKTLELNAFGFDHFAVREVHPVEPEPGDVIVALEAASLNSRDCQIADGTFSPNVSLPLVPLSDGAGEVIALGDGVSEFSLGDRVTPVFFPLWQSGEALKDERSVSLGLEWPGVAREQACYPATGLVSAAPHLTAAEAACLPCAGVTAWSALVLAEIADSQAPWVLIQGTGGVATLGLLLAKAMGARVIILSSSDERLERAKDLGADVGINYRAEANWGETAFEHSSHGVDLVLETGGTGTLPQSLAAIRHGGHIAIIGYMDGIELGTTVFPLIIKNAHLHGLGVGSKQAHQDMMTFIAAHEIRPAIAQHYALDQVGKAMGDLQAGGHFGKLLVDIGDSS